MKKEGESSSVIARSLGISVRRVNQVWKQYRETGAIPAIGKKLGKPPDPPLSEREKEIIREVKQKYKLGAYERACTFYRPSLLGRKKT